MKYMVLIFTLLHYSLGNPVPKDEIFQQIQKHLEELRHEHIHFEFGHMRAPSSVMINNSCGCEKSFADQLKTMLNHVVSKNNAHKGILCKLRANIRALTPKQDQDASKCKTEAVNSIHELFNRNKKYIQSWTEDC